MSEAQEQFKKDAKEVHDMAMEAVSPEDKKGLTPTQVKTDEDVKDVFAFKHLAFIIHHLFMEYDRITSASNLKITGYNELKEIERLNLINSIKSEAEDSTSSPPEIHQNWGKR